MRPFKAWVNVKHAHQAHTVTMLTARVSLLTALLKTTVHQEPRIPSFVPMALTLKSSRMASRRKTSVLLAQLAITALMVNLTVPRLATRATTV